MKQINSEILKEKTIRELDDVKFEIPEYQRGYRWEEKQVKKILQDILDEFKKDSKRKYYLQPIIVKEKAKNIYYLVDGQQRLTTIYMLLKYNLNNEYKCYSIKYNYITSVNNDRFEIDEKIKEYYDTKTIKYENLNDYYYEKALKTIYNWLKDNQVDSEFFDFIRTKVTVMWYELEKEDDDKKAFLRVNTGKIKLTTADLIKAELLKEDKKNKKVIDRISKEWNEIENKLHDNSFWYFVSNEITNDRMTEFLNMINKNSNDLYEKYQEKINKPDANIEKIWEKDIKNVFQNFIEWYEDDEIYNFIGFLVKEGDNNELFFELKEEYYIKNNSKNEFTNNLKNRIKKVVYKLLKLDLGTEIDKEKFKNEIEKLQYGDDEIMTILLLYNILTTNYSKDSKRFPFDKYFVNKEKRKERTAEGIKDKKIMWSLEHISSQHENKNIEKLKDFRILTEYFKTMGIDPKEIPTSENWEKNKENAEEKMKEIFDKIFDNKKNKIEMHGIGNLALLDRELNSSNGNNFFIIKRNNIIRNSKDNYVPICTMKAFLKAFYTKKDSLKKQQFLEWKQEDYDIYEQDIIDTIYDNIMGDKNYNGNRQFKRIN